MFESPGDVIKQEKAEYKCTGLESILDVDGLHQLRLPHFVPDNEPDGLPRISDEILINILDGKYGESFDDILIVDCRFEYEFEGGHIDGAVNFNDKELLSEKLFKGLAGRSTLLVLHCEYSAHRAPIMYVLCKTSLII